jgi:hypothetical protein
MKQTNSSLKQRNSSLSLILDWYRMYRMSGIRDTKDKNIKQKLPKNIFFFFIL